MGKREGGREAHVYRQWRVECAPAGRARREVQAAEPRCAGCTPTSPCPCPTPAPRRPALRLP